MTYIRVQRNSRGAYIGVPINVGKRPTDEEQLQAALEAKRQVREAKAPDLKDVLDTNADEYVSAREIEAGLDAGTVTPEEVLEVELERENPRSTVLELVATEPKAEEETQVKARAQCPHCSFSAASAGGLSSHVKAKHG
jgi:hypothetical protein